VWPPETGARLRNFHLADALARRCAVTLLQLRPPTEQVTHGEQFRNFERVLTFEKDRSYTPGKILHGLLGPTPLPVLNYSSPSAAESLTQLLTKERFDAVQFEGVHLLSYANLLSGLKTSPAILIDWHNIESELMRRYAATEGNWAKKLVARRTATLLNSAESRLLRTSKIHTVPSERERKTLVAREHQNEIHVVPNGVDVARFSEANKGAPRGDSNTVLFVGSMDYHANIDAVTWFTRQIWPVINAQHGQLKFTIVGRGPGPEIQKLASESVCVTGTVPDVLPFYEGALAVVVPLRVGGGTRLKILEAMAAGVPVISTRLGAEGLEVSDETNILLADTPGEIASAVGKLKSDVEFRRYLANNGRLLVSQKYDWDALGQQLYRIHERQVTGTNT
jgi:glycosyltransferase involved in cell wall biosynthesis